MPGQTVGKIPDFTTDDSVAIGQEEVKEVTDEVIEPEKETPSAPPAEEKPAPLLDQGSEDTEAQRKIQALEEQRVKLLKEISELRGQRREIKQEKLLQVDEQIQEMKDVHPEDAAIVEKVLRAKGYIRKDEAHQMFYDSVKQEELSKFLSKYPEYKPENDQNDLNWSALQRELGYYKMPSDPHAVGEILERAHRAVARVSSDPIPQAKKRQLEVAGVGAGGVQRSSSKKTLDPRYRQELERGGWSEEEIKRIESNLT